MAGWATNEAAAVLGGQYAGVAYVAPTSKEVFLATADPGVADSPVNEVAGGSYARQTLGMTSTPTTTAPSTTSNTAVLNFTGMPATNVTHSGVVGSFGAVTPTKRQMVSGALTSSVQVLAGQTLSFAVGAYQIRGQ